MVNSKCLSGLIFSAALTVLSSTNYAQTATPPSTAPGVPATRMEIRMERDEFLKLHRYDDTNGEWTTIAPSTSDLSRAEVKAARNQYLSNNRWSESNDAFTPLTAGPRDMGTMTREEVKMERMQFARTYSWDNQKSMWVLKPMRTAR